jgi:uncharacterized protein (DUF58 family)
MPESFDDMMAGFPELASLPWLILLLFSIPWVVLATTKRIYPHLSLVALLGIPTLLTACMFVWSELILFVLVGDVIFCLLAIADLFTLPHEKSFSAERNALRIASLGMPHRVELVLSNLTNRPYILEVRDDVPDAFQATPGHFKIRLAGRSRATMHYNCTAQRRGRFFLTCVYTRVRSRYGLWHRFLNYPCETELLVYPDMKQLSEYAVLARTNRLSLMGVRRTRKIGTDNEFERLRDYTRDDNYKHLDWRATARRNRLTVKDFQTSHSQRLIFLLDCGRMMTNEAAGLTLLDHSLNAMLMLSYVALRQGDAVGLICFSDRIQSYVPPRGSMSQMNRLLHASFDRFPHLVESRYDEAFLYLSAHCQKRALVILITNLIDEVNAHQVEQYLGTLVGRHLPLGVLLRDHRLFDAAELPQRTERDLFRAAAAAEILLWRQQVIMDLQRHGVLAVDVFPEEMTAPLVNRYLEIKARHLL